MSDDTSSKRIAVSDEMIDAGIAALKPYLPNGSPDELAVISKMVYRAMERVHQSHEAEMEAGMESAVQMVVAMEGAAPRTSDA